ncbi:S8 family serine peptidase [Neobacillus drentensis]|uniref:S8 family serine peptidase n=1 Tax=Neobacillus drentensis TaxID=220684 RepID=UPI00286239A5|nr:S8 family serine peptidase [Neobacillus drentensis]MDR7238023.1 subtilisin family serine protease [Neobacillus drentensis]
MKKNTFLSLPLSAVLLASTIFTGSVQATAQTGPSSVVIGQNQVNTSKNLRKSQMKEVKTENYKVSSTKKQESKLETEIKEKLNIEDSQSTNKYQSGELIIKYKKKVTAGEVSTVLKKYSLKSQKKLKSLNAEVVKIPAGQSTSEYISKLEKDVTIESVQPNFKYYASDINNAPNYYEQLWGLNNSGQSVKEIDGLLDIDVDAPEGWKKFSSTLPEVVVGVIDTGVDINHPDLVGKIWENTKEIPNNNEDDDGNGYTDDVHGWDFYNDDKTVYDPLDGDEHGTHVSGTIAAELEGATTDDNKGVVGVAPNVKILPIKFLGPDGGTTSDAIEAIAYAKKMGVKITNNSWGGEEYDPLLEEAIENCDCLFVAAAGNDAMDNDFGGFYPASFENANILTVAAVDNKGKLAPFSNYGTNSVDVAAPGVDILSTVPKFPLAELTKSLNLEQPGASAQISGDNYKAIFDGIGYEKYSESQRQDAFNKALSYLDLDSTKNILLVQDDESDLAELFKNEPELRALFKNYLHVYQKLLADHPSLKTITVSSDSSLSDYLNSNDLSSYDGVIWFTGNGLGFFSEQGTTLTATDADMLKNYLSNGGKLLLTGQNALSGQEKSPFVKDYLHLTVYPDRGPSLNVEGLSDGIYDNTKYDINRYETPYYFADFIKSNDSRTVINSKYVSDYSQAYDYYSGTSMAAPHTTGTAAVLLGLRPSMSPEMLKLYTSAKGKSLETLKGRVSSGKLVKTSNLDNFNDNETPGIPLENSVQNDKLDGTTDKNDVYALSLKEGEAISFSLNGKAGTDFDLYVFNESTTSINNTNGMVAYSENAKTSNESIKFTAPKTGIYFVDVYAYKGAGDYKLFTGNFGGTYEDDSNSMTFLGGWTPVFNPKHSGNTAITLNSIGEVNFSFVGYRFEWQGYKDPSQGIADIYIDGSKIASQSLYADTFKAKQTIYKKDFSSYGRHTVKIVWTGINDPASRKSASGINLDKFIVSSNPVSLKAYYDKGKKNPVIKWSSVGWAESYSIYRKESSQANYVKINKNPFTSTSYADTTALPGKSYNYSVVIHTKEKWETPFSSPITFVYDDEIKGSLPIAGTVKGSLNTNTEDIYDVWSKRLDKGKTYEITLSGPSAANFDLSLFNIGTSTIYGTTALKKSKGTASSEKIVFKPLKSGLYYIVPSALKGSGQYSLSLSVQTAKMVENTNAAIKYSGNWTKLKYTKASGKTINQTTGNSGSLEYAFSGTGITLYSVKDKNLGKADIYIDGVKVKRIDLYSSSRKYKAIVFNKQSLANKAHKIKIVATGKKTSKAKSALINIDAFKVMQFTLVKK